MWVRIYWKDKKASKEIRRELLDRGKTAARLNWSFRMQVVYKMVQICPGVVPVGWQLYQGIRLLYTRIIRS